MTLLHPYVRRAARALGVAAIAIGAVAAPAAATDKAPDKSHHQAITVFAHRGASGYRPEHTLAAYALGDQAGGRLHRAGSREHQGRCPGRPSRERDQRHDRRRRPPRVRAAQDDQDHRRHADHRLVHRGLHPAGAQDAPGQGAAAGRTPRQHPVRRALRDPDIRRGPRPRQVREPQARPNDRRRPGDQAPDLLPFDRPAPGEAAPAFADPRRAQLAARQGRHPVVRDVATCGPSRGRPASRSSS